MILSRDQGDKVQDLVVSLSLTREPPERITVALYFKPVQAAIYDGKVNATVSVAQSKLVENHRLRVL
ncbi:MAG TPA: hypothetical protein VG204_17985 [Terriglobia bacterium]|nr:hypothetical protein [Terriglobia bacterium]